MARNIEYRVSLKADTSGARDVAGAFSTMDRHAGELAQSFVAVQGVTRGSILGMANMARQIGFLATAAKGLQAAMGWLGLALGVLQVAWGMLRDKQKKAADELQTATNRLAAAQQRLNELRSAAKAPSYEPEIKALRDLADAYSVAEDAAKKLRDVQARLAQAQTAAQISQIEKQAAREAKDVADPRERARIEFGARREAASVQYNADLDALDKEEQAKREDIVALEQKLQNLEHEAWKEKNWSTPLKEAQAEQAAAEKRLARARRTSVGTEQLNPLNPGNWFKTGSPVYDVAEQAAAMEALRAAEEKVQRFKRESEQIRADRDLQIRETTRALETTRQEQGEFGPRRETLNARFAATETSDWAAFKSADQKMRDAEAEKNRLQNARAEAKRQEEAVTASAEQKQDTIKQRTEAASSEYNQALNDEQRLRSRILSPSARRAQDREARSADKEELRLEKSLERARTSRGRGKWKDDVEQYWSARITAAQKRDELKQLEQDAMRAQVYAKVELEKIREFLEKNLQLAGGAGVA